MQLLICFGEKVDQKLTIYYNLINNNRQVILQIQTQMSNSRLKNTSSKSFLNQPIEYRQIVHNRNGHQALSLAESQSRTLIAHKQQSPPTQSRLQHILQQPNHDKKLTINYSISLPKSNRQKTPSKNDMINTGKLKRRLNSTIKSSKNDSILFLGRSPVSKQQNAIQKDKQKLQLKQIKLQPLNRSIQSASHSIQNHIQQNGLQKIQEINARLEDIVSRKLKLLLGQTRQKSKNISNSKTAETMMGHINQELQELIYEIKALKNIKKGTEVSYLNKKIAFIQTILAQHTTQSELMKKHYYKMTSNKKKGKVGDFNHIKTRIGDIYQSMKLNDRQKKYKSNMQYTKNTKPLFEQTTSKQAYKQPRLQDYQSYRYKQKNIAINLQPLPRSSYKRQFLYLRSQPDELIVNRDHSPFNPNSKLALKSIYQKDYRSIKTEVVDHRGLDAYKNKIKILKVNYMPKNRLQTVNYDRQCYYKDVRDSRINSPSLEKHRASQNEINFSKHMLKSEAHRSFQAQNIFERSQIKHQQLKQFQYKLKNLFKA